MVTVEHTLAALKKLGPAGRKAIAKQLAVSGPTIGTHLKKMLAAGDIKSTGKGRGLMYALPDQDFAAPAGAPPKNPKAKDARKGKKKGARRKGARTPSDPKPAAPVDNFLPAMTFDNRLVLIKGADIRIHTQEHTSAIADLMLAHFTQ
jgi:hypothetical protein